MWTKQNTKYISNINLIPIIGDRGHNVIAMTSSSLKDNIAKHFIYNHGDGFDNWIAMTSPISRTTLQTFYLPSLGMVMPLLWHHPSQGQHCKHSIPKTSVVMGLQHHPFSRTTLQTFYPHSQTDSHGNRIAMTSPTVIKDNQHCKPSIHPHKLTDVVIYNCTPFLHSPGQS
jgi:hypothetical protein